jgi:epoxyqueuosine reductase
MDLSAFVKNFATQHGFTVGICDVEPLTEARVRIASRVTPFVSSDVDKRTDPGRSLPNAKSVIVLGMGHAAPAYTTETSLFSLMGEPLGLLSSLCINDDYHLRLKTALSTLAESLECELSPDDTLIEAMPSKPSSGISDSFHYKILADSGILDERALAVRAGLGLYGRNGMVVSPVFGPFFHIGVLLTDIPYKLMEFVEYNHTASCPKNCQLCADACPSGAIPPEGYAINALACVSYLTQKPGPLTEAEMASMGRQLYGCDICRQVCPFGQRRTLTPPELSTVPLTDWLTISDAEFTKRYAHTAMLWRGTDILRRNALIVLGNVYKKEKRAPAAHIMPLVNVFLSHTDESIRAAARFALKNIS